jgi:hypothetical protein
LHVAALNAKPQGPAAIFDPVLYEAVSAGPLRLSTAWERADHRRRRDDFLLGLDVEGVESVDELVGAVGEEVAVDPPCGGHVAPARQWAERTPFRGSSAKRWGTVAGVVMSCRWIA